MKALDRRRRWVPEYLRTRHDKLERVKAHWWPRQQP